MRISQIQIKRFGVWQALTVAVPHHGVNVFYGPNEAGKTTLMRFIRGVLYGFDPYGSEVTEHGSEDGRIEGALRIEWNESCCDIQRVSKRGSRGLVSVTGLEREAPAEKLLSELLAGANQKVFENVFAVGLHELQELATLQEEDVAQHVYGMTLGPDGQRLLSISAELEGELCRLLDVDGRSGELGELIDRDTELESELDAVRQNCELHAELCSERDSLESQIAGLKSRQAELNTQLRGHELLERVWGPWNEVRELRSQLDAIPDVRHFPEGGLDRLDEIDADLKAIAARRDEIRAEAKLLREEAARVKETLRLHRHAAPIQNLADEGPLIRELCERIDALSKQKATAEEELAQKLGSLGEEWTAQRLAAVDTSPQAYHRLVGQSRSYRSAMVQKARLKRHLQQRGDACHRSSVELDAEANRFGEMTVEQALAATKQQLAELERLGKLRLCEIELDQRCTTIREQMVSFEGRPPIPRWVFGVLAFFGVAGVFFVILGLLSGVTTSWVAGLVYALLGLTCGEMAWALKLHLQGADGEKLDGWRTQLDRNEVELRRTREAIGRLVQSEAAASESSAASGQAETPIPGDQPARPVFPSDAAKPTTPADLNGRHSIAAQIAQSTRRLGELERLAERQRRIQADRRRLSELRSRFQNVRQRAGLERQNWCELLQQIGLPETVHIEEAFETWQRVAEAGQQQLVCEKLDGELRAAERAYESVQRRLETLGNRIDAADADYSNPLEVLAAWEEQLRHQSRDADKYRELRREASRRRRKAAGCRAQINKRKLQRNALLVRGGAASREEFEQRAGWVEKREELQELLALAESELEAAAQAEPDLAVVEEDLASYDEAANAERIQSLKQKLDELGESLQEAFEKLGGVKKSMETVESDRRSSELCFEQAQLRGAMKSTAEKWFACLAAYHAIDRVRSTYERTCQPATLAAASKYLTQLTGGRYRNIWTPLGQRHLRVDDDRRNTFRVEQLSNGTREQLFLAIRLALVHELSRKGIELPVVLDDIMVNFDQARTEASIDTLMEFAGQGHQILLLTCHLHLAEYFKYRGIEPIWLPAQQSPQQERRAG